MITIHEQSGPDPATTPVRFSSVRYKKRSTVRRPSFRDDSFAAIRYDKTVPGEAPIPIPMRNPLRPSSQASFSRPVSSAGSFSSCNTGVHIQSSVVVVNPPIPIIAPPTEQHPALRETPPSAKSSMVPNERKRDSGHGAASTSSTPTIAEEDGEYEFSPFRTSQDSAPANSVQPELSQGARPMAGEVSSISDELKVSTTSLSRYRPASPHPGQGLALERPTTPASPTRSLSSRSPAGAVPSSPRRRLVRSLSLRSAPSLRGSDIFTHAANAASTANAQDVTADAAVGAGSGQEAALEIGSVPMQPLVRGWPESPEAAKINGTGSTTTNTSKQPPSPHRWSPTTLWKKGTFSSKSRSSSLSSTDNSHSSFAPLAISIPTDSLIDDAFIDNISFSKRGSVMFGGQRALSLDSAEMEANPISDNADAQAAAPSVDTAQALGSTSLPLPRPVSGASSSEQPSTGEENRGANSPSEPSRDEPAIPPPPSTPAPSAPTPSQTHKEYAPTPDIRVMAADLDSESQKVRSLYAVGDANGDGGSKPSSRGGPIASVAEVPVEEGEINSLSAPHAPSASSFRSADSSPLPPEDRDKFDADIGEHEEEWDDLEGVYVDRYGFINELRPSSRLGTPSDLKSVQYSPRKRNVLQKRDAQGLSSPLSGNRGPSRKVSARSLHTTHSGVSAMSMRSTRSVMRQASNLLPHNRNRRWMDEAGDMLTVSPSLQDVSEEAKVEKISEALKRKEWERSEKWRKMAKNVKKGSHGQGMEFEFDVKNPKVIERTWKGIPDRWRSAAWWSFLATSAKNDPNSPSEERVIADFYRLQQRASADDVQIDLDVPRTISRHVMFRKRYRGGQRLLFRVMHALSLYFPETGYVQGMASLGATLLCYFDEEKCFVMLVRMWQLRGLDRLYRPGFEGLMTALQEFESSWLNKEVARKLTEQCIDPTAYGTRWYLTLYNLSIPFGAQLRVWDVFLLLGEGSAEPAPPQPQPNEKAAETSSTPPSTGLDILHATGAALIHALREVLLDSDFENLMKVLTSFMTIKDEDLLMKVAKAEWKSHQSKKKA